MQVTGAENQQQKDDEKPAADADANEIEAKFKC